MRKSEITESSKVRTEENRQTTNSSRKKKPLFKPNLQEAKIRDDRKTAEFQPIKLELR